MMEACLASFNASDMAVAMSLTTPSPSRLTCWGARPIPWSIRYLAALSRSGKEAGTSLPRLSLTSSRPSAIRMRNGMPKDSAHSLHWRLRPDPLGRPAGLGLTPFFQFGFPGCFTKIPKMLVHIPSAGIITCYSYNVKWVLNALASSKSMAFRIAFAILRANCLIFRIRRLETPPGAGYPSSLLKNAI